MSTSMPRPSSIRTRSDLLAIGQGDHPWRFLSIASGTLAHHPEDYDLLLLCAANASAIGLPTLAREFLDGLPQSLQTDPGVGQVVMMIESLPDDRVDTELLSTRARRIADTMRARGVSVPDDALEATLRGLRRATVLRAADGNIVRRDVDDTSWSSLADIRGDVSIATLSYLRSDGTPDPEKVPRGIILDGIDPPWLLERLDATLPELADGFQTPLFIIEERIEDALIALSLSNGGETWAGSTRFHWLIGPNSLDQLRSLLLARLDYALPDLVMRSGAPTHALEELLRETMALQKREHQRLEAQMQRVYGGLEKAHWAARFHEAGPGGDPLRVLIPVSRYSTFVHHAAEDLRDSFTAMGHDALILDEPDTHTRLASPAYLRAFSEWRPHLVVSINHPRQQFGAVCPRNIPVLTWIQDQMQHLYRRDIGTSQGPLDFLAGVASDTLFSEFGYPRLQSLVMPVVASSRKFHAEPVPASVRERFACEIAYVSHNSQTPDALHRSLLSSLGSGSPIANTLEEMPARIESLISGGLPIALSNELHQLARDVFVSAGVQPEPSGVTTMLHQWILPLSERMLRHEMLGWAADLCEDRGWRLRIYGRGWDAHPTLGRFAQGPIDHGESLRACYQGARVHLHASSVATVHQRVIECALSGGFPACRITGSDISVLESVASTRLGACEPDATYIPWRQPVMLTTNHSHLMMLMAQRQRLGLPAWQWLCLMDQYRDPARPYCVSEDVSPGWLLGDLSETTFWDRTSFERMMDRAIGDSEFRSNISEGIRSRTLDRLTHDAFVRRVLDFLGERLEG